MSRREWSARVRPAIQEEHVKRHRHATQNPAKMEVHAAPLVSALTLAHVPTFGKGQSVRNKVVIQRASMAVRAQSRQPSLFVRALLDIQARRAKMIRAQQLRA